jgi:capsular exopolysaccharide synthesis family protein
MNSFQNEQFALAAGEYSEDATGAPATSIDFLAIVLAVLRRWKLIAAITLVALVATYGALKVVPSRYKSTVEILVYDPQQEINTAVQKPISPFVDAIGNDAMRTEINILMSKSVALRVASELNLDKDPEFQPHSLLGGLAERLGFPGLAQALGANDQSDVGGQDERAQKLNDAADAVLANVQAWGDAYTLFVTTTSQSPAMAQRLAATIATDYLVSQREARQEALQRVSDWLKGRVDSLQSSVLATEAAIAKLKAENNIRDSESSNFREKQIGELNNQIMKARIDVDEKRARLDQVRSIIDTKGDIQGIAELTASPTLTALRQKQADLTSRAADLQKRLGDSHLQVIATRAELAAVTQQMNDEVQHILGNMTNAYDIAVRQEQALEANLQTLTAHANSGAYVKLSQLQSAADADRKLYEGYLAQYNDITERRTLQTETARVISPATYPRWPSSPKRKVFFAAGGVLGLGGGVFVAFLLGYLLQPGVRTDKEVEQSFGRPVVGIIPLVKRQSGHGPSAGRLVQRMVNEPLSDLSAAVRSLRISLELSHNDAKVILMTSAIPGEGKSTVATLLAASSASSGKKTILLDCDLHNPSVSNALPGAPRLGLSDVLCGEAKLEEVMIQDPVSNIYAIPAGSAVPNAADLLMSQRMRDLIAVLRTEFDYIVVDTPPLLPVIDALVLTSLVDRVLVIVEWSQTPRINISEASKILRPESHRIAGVILNKVDVSQLPAYGYRGAYYYGSAGNYARNR